MCMCAVVCYWSGGFKCQFRDNHWNRALFFLFLKKLCKAVWQTVYLYFAIMSKFFIISLLHWVKKLNWTVMIAIACWIWHPYVQWQLQAYRSDFFCSFASGDLEMSISFTFDILKDNFSGIKAGIIFLHYEFHSITFSRFYQQLTRILFLKWKILVTVMIVYRNIPTHLPFLNFLKCPLLEAVWIWIWVSFAVHPTWIVVSDEIWWVFRTLTQLSTQPGQWIPPK